MKRSLLAVTSVMLLGLLTSPSRADSPITSTPFSEAYSEHRIKDIKLGIKADRLSCSTFVANQFRLLLSQAAYILMITLRQAAAGPSLATAQVERLRLLVIKRAARVRVATRRVLVELAAYAPFADAIRLIAQRLSAMKNAVFD